MTITETDMLFSATCSSPCRVRYCPQTVVEIDGRFYITFGHAGFNSPKNNRDGYRFSSRAMLASSRYRGEVTR